MLIVRCCVLVLVVLSLPAFAQNAAMGSSEMEFSMPPSPKHQPEASRIADPESCVKLKEMESNMQGACGFVRRLVWRQREAACAQVEPSAKPPTQKK